MKLEKAIEILELTKTCEFEGDVDDLVNACSLGVEALKSKLEARKYRAPSSAILLPGETEE